MDPGEFHRGGQGTSSPHRGSGLGLAVVKQLVEPHGGQAGVHSAPDQGTTFRFTVSATGPPTSGT